MRSHLSRFNVFTASAGMEWSGMDAEAVKTAAHLAWVLSVANPAEAIRQIPARCYRLSRLLVINVVFIQNCSEFVIVRIQPLNFDPVAVTKAVSLFQFMAGQLIILSFQAFVIFAEGAVIFHHDSASFACSSRILMSPEYTHAAV